MLAMRHIGRGYTSLQKFSGIMNLPPPFNRSTYYDRVRKLSSAASTVPERSMDIAAQELRKEHPDGEVAVSFDGTWQRRGHSSLDGVCTCIS